jgi:hypothetical protein
MKPATLVTQRLYFGIDALRLRDASSRVLARLHGLDPSRACVSAEDLRRDFGLDTVDGRATLDAMVAEGLLMRRSSSHSEFRVSRRLVRYATARVVDPLPRARARSLVAQACDLAREINSSWARNPLEIEALAPFGAYLSREPHLDQLPLGVVVRLRPASRRARWRALSKTEGIHEVRAALVALSSFVRLRLATEASQLPQPCAIVFQAES